MSGGDHFICSFCGKKRHEVTKLIAGPKVYICNECITLCNKILEQDEGDDNTYKQRLIDVQPQEIKEYLDQYVVGQEQAKKVLAVAAYNHYKRIGPQSRNDDIELNKGNIMLIGPTGCGKTLLAETLAKKLDVPFVIADATCLTEAGYVGEDVESIIRSLLRAADYDRERASHGIVCIDEIDKVARRGEGLSSTRDVSGEGVQQALLKIIEGKETTIPPEGGGQRHRGALRINTTNVLFICNGSFNGLEKLIERRVGVKNLGFSCSGQDVNPELSKNELLQKVESEDLMKYGLIPELVGRIPVAVACTDLDEEALVEILWRPRNSLLRQYAKLFSLENVKLTFTDEAMHAVAKEAVKRKSGARGLRAIIEECLLDVMYELPDAEGVQEVVVTKETITDRHPPMLIHKKKSA